MIGCYGQGLIDGVCYEATCTEIVWVPGDDDIDSVGQRLADTFKGLSSHDHMMWAGRLAKIFEICGQVPGDLAFRTYCKIMLYSHDTGYFHGVDLLE